MLQCYFCFSFSESIFNIVIERREGKRSGTIFFYIFDWGNRLILFFTVHSAKPISRDMSTLSVETEDSCSSIFEVAANNDVEIFKRMVEHEPSVVDEVGLWLVRKDGTKQIVQEERTPLMVAATYGCVDVLKLIVSLPEVDLNQTCGPNRFTALHCATSGASANAVDVVKVLLSAGANPNVEDSCGRRPVDVIAVPLKLAGVRVAIEELLMNNIGSDGFVGDCNLRFSASTSSGSSPILSSSPDNGSLSPPSKLLLSCAVSKLNDVPATFTNEKREYPHDPSLPDIKNSVYITDEFRMFSFKVRPCSRAYSHDWTECPFVHPGENARRRDLRKYHYSCVPCPDFRKGACRRGDMCEYAHGVFESWLHPAQYRTRLCKDGTSCARRVCFFAHTGEELRPLYVSTGSAVPSPRSAVSATSVMDMAAALNLLPGSPSSHSVMSPSAFKNPMSSTSNGCSSAAWPQPNVPTLHLPGSNIQSSRLRSSLSARDVMLEDLNLLSDFDSQQIALNDMVCFTQSRPDSSSLNRSGRLTLNPSNLEDLFSAEIMSSPRFADQAAACGGFSPTHKSAVINQFQQHQSILSPINTSSYFSPRNVDHSLLQTSFGVPSLGRMSPRSVDPISPMSACLSPAHRENRFQQRHSLSSRDLGSNGSITHVRSPVNSWYQWGGGPPHVNGRVDWSVGDDFCQLKRSYLPQLQQVVTNNNGGEEPDLSWVQLLVKEPSHEMNVKSAAPISSVAVSSGEGLMTSSPHIDSVDHSVLGAWLEQMQLDQLVGQ